MKLRVCDYIARYIYQVLHVDTVFMLTGGGAIFLNDGIAKYRKFKVVSNHHQQAAAMGAVAYSKYTRGISVMIPTTGCGGTNTITGLLDAWQDGCPVLFISGQVNNQNTRLRQSGVQQANILSMVKPITKYSMLVNDGNQIQKVIQEAIKSMLTGRPGPAWIDIPLDVQSQIIQDQNFTYALPKLTNEINVNFEQIYGLIEKSQRPIILAGNGINNILNGKQKFLKFIQYTKIPFVYTYLGKDIGLTDHTLFTGMSGIKGDRAGNFALCNSDLIIVLGASLAVANTGYLEPWFNNAKMLVIDIENREQYRPIPNEHVYVQMNLTTFFQNFKLNVTQNQNWVKSCERWKSLWTIYQQNREVDKQYIDLYDFIKNLNQNLSQQDIIVSDAGSAFYVTSQAIQIVGNRRYITSGAQAQMGFTIPACIGASFASNGKRVIGITGDGSFQLNIQQLQTIKHNALNIKLFVFNNNGYLSIRNTQIGLCDCRHIGVDCQSGVSFPELKRIAEAYDINYHLMTPENIELQFKQIMKEEGNSICQVICNPNQKIVPSSATVLTEAGVCSTPLSQMNPPLSNEILEKQMIKTKEIR